MIVSFWAELSDTFNYEIADFQNAGTFTQMIWRGSREIGFSLREDGTNTLAVVLYYPAGNIISNFTENVAPPLDMSIANN